LPARERAIRVCGALDEAQRGAEVASRPKVCFARAHVVVFGSGILGQSAHPGGGIVIRLPG